MNELGIYRRKFGDKQNISYEIQKSTPLIKCELQSSIEKVMQKNKSKEKKSGLIVTDCFVEYESSGKPEERK